MRLGIQLQYRQKTLWVCVEVGLDGTKKLFKAVPQYSLNCCARLLTSPLAGLREVVSAFVL